ncbi:MAG: tyrosine-type recombinase/integrase [Campylobacter sp.]
MRKSTGLADTKSNVAYIYRNIIPEIQRKLKAGLNPEKSYLLSEFTQKVLEKTKAEKKRNTILVYEIAIKRFLEFVGDKDVGDYCVGDIEDFVSTLNARTARAYLAPISLAFKIAIKRDIILKNPCIYADLPKIKQKQRQPFDKDSVKSLIDYAKGELKTFLYFAFYTGARANEILALTWQDINECDININKTYARGALNSPKNGKTRRVILLEPLRNHLNTLKRKNDEIFKSGYSTISRKFKLLQKDLGLKPQGLHITRHTFTSLLINGGIKPTLAQQILGHSSLVMTNLYTHYLKDDNDKNELMRALL